jgi:AraC-like DNA-binding protein/mannose-6-phosphate isomerase-like protein (cupin superfamily)
MCSSDLVRTLRLDAFLPAGAAYRIARVKLMPSHRMEPHTHDFAEVFWIERGTGLHLVNGERRPLARGDVVLVRPEDVHTFRTTDPAGLTQVNVAFGRETLDFLKERYFDAGDWPWQGDSAPAAYRFRAGELGWSGELAGMLFAGPTTRLVLERFLLSLLLQLGSTRLRPGLPVWLNDALDRLARDPDALARGVPALAALAGRSREHVNRVARRGCGRTATELVQATRLDRAAADLRLTDFPISRIAADCGMPNLSHFHRLFRARFATTPRRYRIHHQSLVHGEPLPGAPLP